MFLLENNKKQKDRLPNLHDIINTISLSKDMRGLLEATLNKTLKALSSDRGSIYLTGDDGQELFLRWAYNMRPELGSAKKKIGEGVIGRVARDRKPILVRDIRSDSRFHISQMYHDYKTNSFLCVPIATEQRLIGVISITENKSRKPYTEKHLKFLEIIAERIASKIEKSQLLSELDQLKKKTETDGKLIDLGKFTSGISHELNSPLDGVIRYVNLALGTMEEGVAREYLLEAKGGLTRIANIINSLLELTRRKRPSTPKMIDVNERIEDCVDILRYEAMYKGIEIKKDLAMGLPKIPDLGIESILSNIFKNALDALDEKGCIDISTSLEGDSIKIAISDTGCGIHKDNINRIFEPFFSTKEKTQGAGLGLSICYEIVKQYNGKIDVSSAPGKGTRFVVSLPCGTKG